MIDVKLRRLTPLAEVRSVTRSIDFYSKLGFEVGNTFVPPGEEEPTWAWLHQGGADLMLGRADASRQGSRQSVLFYCYCDDVAEARSRFVEAGFQCGVMMHPFYAPNGEFEVEDPDGYKLIFTHT